MYSKSIFIPHASRALVGSCRKVAFESTFSKNVDFIIVIHAHHDVSSKQCALLYKDSHFPTGPLFPKLPFRPQCEDEKKDRSFQRLFEELRDYYPDALILAFGVSSVRQKYWIDIANWIISFCKNFVTNSLVVGSADMFHHGERFGSQQQCIDKENLSLYKMKQEEELISFLLLKEKEVSYQKIKNLLTWNKHEKKAILRKCLTCGAGAILFFAFVTYSLKRVGRVLDYRDSSANPENPYCIFPINAKINDEFVSYVSIGYMDEKKYHTAPRFSRFDELFALGIFKSIFLRAVLSFRQTKKQELPAINYKVFFPMWSPFHFMKNGVFAKTSLQFEYEEKSTYSGPFGFIEEENSLLGGIISTADKMIEAFELCVEDIVNCKSEIFQLDKLDENNVMYRIELLEERTNWESFLAKDFCTWPLQTSKKNQGIHLFSEKTKKEFTFLPEILMKFEEAKWNRKRWIIEMLRRITDENVSLKRNDSVICLLFQSYLIQ